MRHAIASVASLLPDVAQWIEVRSMLLAGRARIVGSMAMSPPSFVALHQDGDQAVVVGRASPVSILEAAAIACEILAATEDTPWVAGALPEWKVETAVLFKRDARSPLPEVMAGQVRFLASSELAAITDARSPVVPDDLRDELRSAARSGVPIAASFDDEKAAAFCYAGSITETLWDVSIDTLEPYQRRGHAMKAAAFLIAHYQTLGKEPVWGALLSNAASRSLATRLGFAPVGSLSVFTAPAVAHT